MLQSLGGYWSPAVDLYETQTHLILFVELPGMRPPDVEVFARSRSVVVRGVRGPILPGLAAERLEIRTGRFEREIDLPARIEASEATAEMRDGVLRIEMPLMPAGPVRIGIDPDECSNVSVEG